MKMHNLSVKPKRIGRSAAIAFTAALLGANHPFFRVTFPAQAQSTKPTVVATTALLCDVTKQIAQDTVDLKCLMDGGSDPHLYEPKPDDRKAIEQAKLILYAGYDFEPALIKLIQATSNPAPKVAVNELAVPKPQTFEEDGQTETDPHVFHSAANGAAIVKVVGKSLAQLSPSQAKLYTTNTQKLANEFTQIHAWIKSRIASIPAAQRKLVTTHDAFGYYSTAYSIPVAGALQGISTEEKATPKRVAELVENIRSSRVATVFAETTINPKLIEAVAREAKVKVAAQELFADGIGEPDSPGETYQKMLMSNTKTIVEGLGGTFTVFQGSASSIGGTTQLPVGVPGR